MIFEIFNGECDTTIHMTSNDLINGIFGTNRFLIYDFL